MCAGTGVTLQQASAATVVSTEHYQASLQLQTCSGSNGSCIGDFPAPGPKRRLNLTRVTCHLAAPQGAVYINAYVTLLTASNHAVVFEFLPLDYSGTASGNTQFLLNRAIDLHVASAQHVRVTFDFSGGNPFFGLCKVSGTLDTVQ
jgi:hypothetical protein